METAFTEPPQGPGNLAGVGSSLYSDERARAKQCLRVDAKLQLDAPKTARHDRMQQSFDMLQRMS